MKSERVARTVRQLYGEELPRSAGVVHVAAVWESPAGAFHNMRIVADTPESPTDAWVLALARARADAIVTTGKILREEPSLRFELAAGPDASLSDWRGERLGRATPPWVVVLTGGGELDPAHPALRGERVLVLTGRERAAEVAARLADLSAEVIGRERPGLLDALALLRGERGLATAVVEAGPSTASVLYEAPGRVDELLLSVCRAPELAGGVRGDPFPSRAMLERAGLGRVSRRDRDEPSGPWSFERFVGR